MFFYLPNKIVLQKQQQHQQQIKSNVFKIKLLFLSVFFSSPLPTAKRSAIRVTVDSISRAGRTGDRRTLRRRRVERTVRARVRTTRRTKAHAAAIRLPRRGESGASFFRLPLVPADFRFG